LAVEVPVDSFENIFMVFVQNEETKQVILALLFWDAFKLGR
jgi:hypothetical protein